MNNYTEIYYLIGNHQFAIIVIDSLYKVVMWMFYVFIQ